MKVLNYQLFFNCIADLLGEEDVQSMGKGMQHIPSVNTLGHCLHVSYISYRLCRFLNLRAAEAARGGLLHDMFLYDQRAAVNRKGHLSGHPAIALENASQRFDLSGTEQDAIYNHMWPITPRNFPQSKEAAIVCLVDKICAVAEVTGIYSALRMSDRLEASRYHQLECPA